MRAYRQKNLERLRDKDRRYHAAHRDERRAKDRAWRAKHRQRLKVLRKAIAATPEAQAKSRLYYQENRETILVKHKHYVQSFPKAQKAANARYRARKKGAARSDLTAKQWEEIKSAYGHRCVYCGKKFKRLTKDHIIPLSRGGDHTVSNIVPACMSCNRKKHANAPPVPVQPLLLTLA
jgi:5-methylcytosine-specific restriction endonuclease McrA